MDHSVDDQDALARQELPAMDEKLTAEFDDLLARLQAQEAQAGLRDAFGATPEELGRAAVAAARQARHIEAPRRDSA